MVYRGRSFLQMRVHRMNTKWTDPEAQGLLKPSSHASACLDSSKAKMYSIFLLRFVLSIGVLLSFYLTLVSSLPTNLTPKCTAIAPSIKHCIHPSIKLRILPLGDSITFGQNATGNGDGYRLSLAEHLNSYNFLFVGTQRSGDMADNYSEGHPGYTISQISNVCQPGLDMRPNVVLLHAGTNDMTYAETANEPYADAPKRLGDLIDKVLATNPDAVVLVAQIITVAREDIKGRVNTFNAAVPAVVKQRADAEKKVEVVNMELVRDDMLFDGIHPTAAGYAVMGKVWFNTLQIVAKRGWITAPVGSDPPHYKGILSRMELG